jgi:Flp pilus assembly protein TadG
MPPVRLSAGRRKVEGMPARRHKAQSIVEFAFVAPILIILALGILGFGRAFYTYIDLANAARSGARYAASAPQKPCGTSAEKAALRAAVVAQVKSAQRNLEWSPSSPRTPPVITLECVVLNANGTLVNARRVTITDYEFETYVYFLGTNGVVPISTAATMPLVNQ